jgi:hypothetical protein
MILVLRIIAAFVMLVALAETGWRVADSTDPLRTARLLPGLCARLQPQLQLFLVSAILYLLTLFPRLWTRVPVTAPAQSNRPQPQPDRAVGDTQVPLAQPLSQENPSGGDPFLFGND